VSLLARLLPDEDDAERLDQAPRPEARQAPAPGPLALPWLLALCAAALAPRLVALFVVTDPENAGAGWLGDVYHHWQIAYLTREIGLWAPGGPRLWDLRGLDYFWGVLHPLLLVGLFTVTGSIDIVLARLLSACFGALVVVLIFLLCRRHWGTPVAVAAAAFACVAPTSVFDDASGMLEPLGVGLILLGIWLWPRRGGWAGVLLALAAMARAEAWIFSAGLVVATFLRRQQAQQRLALAAGWAVLMLVYLKVLLDRTGNPIYPVWWNFLANAYGRWEFRAQLTPTQVAVRPLLLALLAFGAVGLALTLWKRPGSYLFLTFGFGYLAFTGGMLGASAYLKSWEGWFWMTRFFVFPYEFAAVLGAIGLFVLAPRVLRRPARPAAWAVVVVALLAVQLEWPPILQRYDQTRPNWANAVAAGRDLGAIFERPEYRGSRLNIPSGNPDVTYTLARYGGVQGRDIIGQLYDPFYYLPAGYAYRDHRGVAGTLMRCWLSQTRTRVWAIQAPSDNYTQFVADNPGWFRTLGTVRTEGWMVQEVNVPPPAPGECLAADRSARS